MNKIYKVIFNKAKGCYVVVSEFAKSHTKSVSAKRAKVATRGTGATLAAIFVVGILTAAAMPMTSQVLGKNYDDKYKGAWNAIETLYFTLYGPDTSRWPLGPVLSSGDYTKYGYTLPGGYVGHANTFLSTVGEDAHAIAMRNFGAALGSFEPGHGPTNANYSVLLNDVDTYGYSNYDKYAYVFKDAKNNVLDTTMVERGQGYHFNAGENSVIIGNKAWTAANESVVIGKESRIISDFGQDNNGFNVERSVAIGFQVVGAHTFCTRLRTNRRRTFF